MSRVYHPSDYVVEKSLLPSFDEYKKMHKKSIEDPEGFWSEIANEFYWQTPYQPGNFVSYNFNIEKGNIFIKWMEGAVTNVCFNLLDRNVRNGHGDKIAYYWEGNHPDDYSRITYKKLLSLVCQFANALRENGIRKGDKVSIYMPMVMETIVCMLACARIGAVHSVVFAGFSCDSLAERMSACEAKVLVTADGAWRGEKLLNLKQMCDDAMQKAKTKFNHSIEKCIVVSHLKRVTACGKLPDDLSSMYNWNDDVDVWWHDFVEGQSTICPPEWMEAEDPLFMLYTSGSTGKPKGVLHTTAGYLLHSATSFRYVFDYRDKDVFWCTADVGWITGHTYVVYAPLANAATSLVFEGTPFYPDNDRYWSIVEKYKVTQFYTAPTAIRSLMKFGDGLVAKHNLQSLRVLASVGEPINPEAWHWYYNVIGGGRCSISDTFFQTETGGHVLTPLPGATPMKPGSAGFPFFGVEPALLDEEGKIVEGPGEGYLVFARPWPSIMRTLFGDHDRFESTYFSKFPGYYCTGDGARRDEDGFLWVTGRIDDMLNVSGHLMSTSEVEGVLTEEPRVSEAAVVSKPHPVKGESLYCFVILNEGAKFDDDLVNCLKKLVRGRIGAFAAPDVIQYAPGLPKTRSGKIMRRILRKIAIGDKNIGDTSTLTDPSIVEELFKNRPQK
ncbi:acetyl-coenzyme A synthetase [Aricia agestis]|uniref:acetyl-coenzyme A synthetase n=1 Tax=Aricia agestis TaxID=91739 RepID=UPI001C205C40|nr:acetyl-coenzyme A synthetase [Aricia agestis]